MRESALKPSETDENVVPYSGSIDRYFHEIGRTPLLTVEEERELGKRVRQGDVVAREQLIRANLRFVVGVAREFVGRGVAFEDLISEGNLGLIRAAEKFDPSEGCRFCTYAVHWIRQAIRRGLLHQGRMIRLPAHMVEKIIRFNDAAGTMTTELGREPTDAEVAAELGLKAGKVERLRRAAQAMLSLNSVAVFGGEQELMERVVDENCRNPGEVADGRDQRAMLRRALTDLSMREQHVIRERFGLSGDEPRKLEELGQEWGVSRERIRQIEKKALGKLQNTLAKLVGSGREFYGMTAAG